MAEFADGICGKNFSWEIPEMGVDKAFQAML